MSRRILNRKQRFVLLKFLALLSLVRWYNILLIIISQYLTAIFILHPHTSKWQVILDHRLLLIAFASAFLIAAGYIINSFYDLEKDMVNQPKKIIFSRYISKWFSLNCYFLFNFIGLALSYFVNLRILLFNAIFLFGLWFYSHKLKKLTFIGNLCATILSIVPFFSICVYYNKINAIILTYVSFIFIIEFTREIIKDLEAMRGDVIFGYNTLPIAIGVRKTKMFLYFLMAVSFLPPLVLIHQLVDNEMIMIYFIVSAMLVALSAGRLNKASSFAAYHSINNMYKLIILLGIGSIIFV